MATSEDVVTTASDRRTLLACVYSCGGFLVLFGLGWVVLAGFMPPPSPRDSATDLAAQFEDDSLRIRIGMAISIAAAAFLLPWGGAVCSQIRRIEGRNAPLAWAWAAAQGCIVIEFAYPCAMWSVATFRTGDPGRIQTFNDFAFLTFLGIVSTALFQMLALAVVTLQDRRPEPIFPRWFAYFQGWCFLGVAPAGGIFIFKSGPLAWDGIIAYWVAITFAGIWLIGTTVMTARAITIPETAEETGADHAARIRRLEEALAARL